MYTDTACVTACIATPQSWEALGGEPTTESLWWMKPKHPYSIPRLHKCTALLGWVAAAGDCHLLPSKCTELTISYREVVNTMRKAWHAEKELKQWKSWRWGLKRTRGGTKSVTKAGGYICILTRIEMDHFHGKLQKWINATGTCTGLHEWKERYKHCAPWNRIIEVFDVICYQLLGSGPSPIGCLTSL